MLSSLQISVQQCTKNGRYYLYLLIFKQLGQIHTLKCFLCVQAEKKLAPRCDAIVIISCQREDEDDKGALFEAFNHRTGTENLSVWVIVPLRVHSLLDSAVPCLETKLGKRSQCRLCGRFGNFS
jgi:hypothetical protein